MLKMATVFAAGLSLIALTGCQLNNKEDVLNRTNAIYKNIKVIVTDEEVSALLSDDAKEKLKEAERIYLAAVQTLEASEGVSSSKGKVALCTIVSCADTILSVIDTLNITGKYEPVITAARVATKLLKTNIST